MSIKTWIKEFYSKPAKEVSKKNALAHSILKWEGLLKKNLKKHGLSKSRADGFIENSDKNYELPGINYFGIDAESCALCEVHWKDANYGSCGDCPLFKVRGDVSCARPRSDEDDSPYDEFIEHDDARPMLKWLKRAEKFQKS